MRFDIFSYEKVNPFAWLGLTGNFWSVHLDTLINTWIAMFILFVFVLIVRYVVKKEHSLFYFSLEQVIGGFSQLCTESFQKDNFDYFALVISIFIFTFINCLIGVLPYCDEATKDLNTTLALGSISFLYVQYQKISVHGFLGYCKEFTEPFFVLAPVHIVGELAKVASMSFRLFGNILGGGIIYVMLFGILLEYKIYFLSYALIVIVLALWGLGILKLSSQSLFSKIIYLFLGILFLITWIQVFFGIFEGLIQSFVITMLTMTYLAIGTYHEDHGDESHKTQEALQKVSA